MGRKCRKGIRRKVCEFTYRKRGLSRCLACFGKSFHEVYTILNPDADCRK
ncbi:hypothetical protein JQM69_08180 [Faecalicatena contorta]|nr:hypothetical protein [Faecalicatena contorta]